MRDAKVIILFFTAIMLVGTSGYMIFEDFSFWNSIYLTAMTITTVGYGDIVPVHPFGRVFTVFLVFTGVGFVLYTFSRLAEAMVEGGLRNILERRKMDKKVAQLRNHYIVCGYGRIGKVICQILKENKRPFVVIENDAEEIRTIEAEGFFALLGEAADDEILIKAGIKEARGLIGVVSTDADNVFITLTARGLNPGLFILTRSSGAPGSDTKLLRAGASKVISPYYIGARRMAQLVVRPTVIDFIDLTMHAGELGLRMEEMLISEKASFVNKNLMESGIRKKYDIIVVAIKRQGDEMLFNPKPDTVILPGDILIVLGEHGQISALEKEV
ncbi:MAG TPA: potassium channel protein [Desulfobacteraceae bacterium]|nr:potassium channel protein [Desulfobacteraceae bacterium]